MAVDRECLKGAESGPTRVALGRTGIRAIAGNPLLARNWLHHPMHAFIRALSKMEAAEASAQPGFTHFSGSPALRRPSMMRALSAMNFGSEELPDHIS